MEPPKRLIPPVHIEVTGESDCQYTYCRRYNREDPRTYSIQSLITHSLEECHLNPGDHFLWYSNCIGLVEEEDIDKRLTLEEISLNLPNSQPSKSP